MDQNLDLGALSHAANFHLIWKFGNIRGLSPPVTEHILCGDILHKHLSWTLHCWLFSPLWFPVVTRNSCIIAQPLLSNNLEMLKIKMEMCILKLVYKLFKITQLWYSSNPIRTIDVHDQLFDRWSVAMYELDLAFRESVVHFLRQALSVAIQKQKTKTFPAFKEF